MATAGRSVPPTIQHELLTAARAQRGHFRYESGHHGDLWLDLDTLFVDAQRTRRWAAALAQHVATIEPDVVCGPLVGGALLAQLVAVELGVGLSFAARYVSPDGSVSYALPSALGPAVHARRVLVVDDAINAGSAVSATLEALLEIGATPAGIACLLALGPAGAEIACRYAVPFVRLAAVERGLWVPERCPLCAAGVPLARGR
ncbi:MAG: orotate phosphoribosyltransferase [Anaerolineae bacterium]|nr:orotate phosphoribosyltransferase [Anaerolineae bacterium]